MATDKLLALPEPDNNPKSPCLILGERTKSGGEVWNEAEALARDIEVPGRSGAPIQAGVSMQDGVFLRQEATGSTGVQGGIGT